MENPIFHDPKLKLNRANKHILELRAVLDTYVQGNVYHIGTDIDSEGGVRKLHIAKTTPLPSEVPLIIGDVIHNLHTVLDMSIWAIIPEAHRDRTIKFPFYETRNELLGQINKGKIKAHAPGIVDFIINDIKPYKGGNDLIYGLHVLDITDKHQLLIPILDTIELTGVSGEMSGSGTFHNLNFFIQNLDEINAIAGPGDIKITNYGKAAFKILFNKGQPFEGQSVIPTLYKLAEIVDGIIDSVAANVSGMTVR